MMDRIFTCIQCPVGCEITATQEGSHLSITGNLCPKGYGYVQDEMTDPRRNVTSSVLVCGGKWPLVSVRTAKPLQKALIMEVIGQIREIQLAAPVHAGDVIADNLLGKGIILVATREVEAS